MTRFVVAPDVQEAMQQAWQRQLMADGVTILAPGQTYVDPRARIGTDTILYPFTSVLGAAVIGRNCRIGPNAVVIAPSNLADGTTVGPHEKM